MVKAGGEEQWKLDGSIWRCRGEWVTTWAVAAYIDEIARAGKEIYDIFLYTNAWLNEGRGLAGVDWPSGTPRQNNLDIYYAVCTHLTISHRIFIRRR